MASTEEITQVLLKWSDGDPEALEKLVPLVYDKLHHLAQHYLYKEHWLHHRSNHMLQATELINEAFKRLIDQEKISWQNRAHFFGVAAEIMRRILVDHARKRLAAKRWAGGDNLTLDDAIGVMERQDAELIALNDALGELAKIDPRQTKIVELKFFGGLNVEETAEVLKIAPITVKREWATAKAWLYCQVKKSD